MSKHYDLLIRNGRCVLPSETEQVDIGVVGGRIAGVGSLEATADRVVDATGLHVLPGVIDSHVHLRDPGDPSVETLETGTKAAVLGGVTTVFDMPNTRPAIVDRKALGWKQNYVRGRAFCDIGLYVSGTKSNNDALDFLERQKGVCAIKVFMAGAPADLIVDDDASIEHVLTSGRRRVAFHSEDEPRLRERRAGYASGAPYRTHMEWRDEECAFLGTRRLVSLARKTGRSVHVLHVSTSQELEYLADQRDQATVELLVNNLTQIGPGCYDQLGGFAVMNPPIRDKSHYEASWAAVRNGLVDTIGSDHAPHSRQAKEKPWPESPGGLTGVQTLVPVMLDHVNAGRLTLRRLADLTSSGPARVYGLVGKGRIALGYDADFTIVDLNARRTIEENWIASPCGWSPFAGMSVTGWPIMTVLRGAIVMAEDELRGPPVGGLARFQGEAVDMLSTVAI